MLLVGGHVVVPIYTVTAGTICGPKLIRCAVQVTMEPLRTRTIDDTGWSLGPHVTLLPDEIAPGESELTPTT
jgi:hypothetical protein